jgi:beta-galactosidase
MIEADVVDSQGRIDPTAQNEITFTITGQGQIAGTGDGDPSNHELNNSPMRAAFNGKCMAVIQSLDGTPGSMTLTASSPGLTPASVTITSSP